MVVVSPSSLIFVAVVVIWATYLVVHVARHREHLATARSVDRFSSQMRVLQRRAVRLDPPAPSAVRVSSASMARMRPLVAQADPERPFLGEGAAAAVDAMSAGVPAADAPPARPTPIKTSTLAVDADEREPQAPDFFVDVPARAPRLPHRRRPGSRLMRGFRAAALLVTLLSIAGVGIAIAVSAAPWWALVVPALVLAGVLMWLRAAARAAAAQRRREAARRRLERHRREREAAQAARDARPSAPRLPVAQEFVEVAESESPVTAAFELAPTAALDLPLDTRRRVGAGAARLDPLEVAALAPSSMDAATAAPIDPLLEERGWEPTPVPPPTYTLKAKAQRPLPPPLEVPVPIELDDDDIAWDEARHQPRVVSA